MSLQLEHAVQGLQHYSTKDIDCLHKERRSEGVAGQERMKKGEEKSGGKHSTSLKTDQTGGSKVISANWLICLNVSAASILVSFCFYFPLMLTKHCEEEWHAQPPLSLSLSHSAVFVVFVIFCLDCLLIYFPHHPIFFCFLFFIFLSASLAHHLGFLTCAARWIQLEENGFPVVLSQLNLCCAFSVLLWPILPSASCLGLQFQCTSSLSPSLTIHFSSAFAQFTSAAAAAAVRVIIMHAGSFSDSRS